MLLTLDSLPKGSPRKKRRASRQPPSEEIRICNTCGETFVDGGAGDPACPFCKGTNTAVCVREPEGYGD